MDIVGLVEEADIELCASGFDNLLTDPGLKEFREYQELLVKIGAPKCAAIIAEVLAWIDSETETDPIDLIEADKERISQLWARYNSASEKENPRELAAGR